MIDLGISKLALIGAVALIVIGPEKLPRVARTVGTLIGKAQKYVSDVKAEVSRSVELDDLKKLKETMDAASREVENSIQTSANAIESSWSPTPAPDTPSAPLPYYSMARPIKKHWRAKISATPHWYKARSGTRTKALSGAARVARFRLPKSSS